MRSRLVLDTREVGVGVSLGTTALPNKDVMDSAAESLDPGINPPGGIGGGGGGSSLGVVVSGRSLLPSLITGCCTVIATNFPATNIYKKRNKDL